MLRLQTSSQIVIPDFLQEACLSVDGERNTIISHLIQLKGCFKCSVSPLFDFILFNLPTENNFLFSEFSHITCDTVRLTTTIKLKTETEQKL